MTVEQLDTESFIAHYGVKGMKWGVHNGSVGPNASRRERKEAKAQSKLAYKAWKKEVGGEKVANEIFRDASKSFGPAVKAINNDPAFKGKDLTKDRKLARQYDEVVGTVFNQHLAAASIDRTTTNTGRAMIYQFDRSIGMMRATESQLVVHADDEGYPDFKAELDAFGQIVSLKLADDDDFLEQMDSASNFLSHYGVKGMKWGVNRSAVKGALGQRTEAVGKPSKEAKATAKTNAKVKAQKSLRSLSNKELQEAITRMNLEQQYSKVTNNLDKTSQQKVAAFISNLVGPQAKKAGDQAADAYRKDFVEKKTQTGRYAPKANAGGGNN